MNRPWVIWLILVMCGLLIVGAMGWLSDRILGMERDQTRAEAEAEIEERVRLALSRMDTAASGVLVLENQRLPEHYQAFFNPADLFTRTFQPVADGLVVQPSPLLSEPPQFVRLHFEVGAARRLSSPQVPTGNERDLAEVSGVTAAELDQAAARLRELDTLLRASAPSDHITQKDASNLDRMFLSCAPNIAAWNDDLQVVEIEEKSDWMAGQRQMVGKQARMNKSYQQELSLVDQGRRAQVYEDALHNATQAATKNWGKGQAKAAVPRDEQQVADASDKKQESLAKLGRKQAPAESERARREEALQQSGQAGQAASRVAEGTDPGAPAPPTSARAAEAPIAAPPPATSQVAGRVARTDDFATPIEPIQTWSSTVTPFRPVWLGGELFAVRLVQSPLGRRYQGVWLEAEALKDYLLESVSDQLPQADLVPVDALVGDSLQDAYDAGLASRVRDGRSLVTMPWRLVDGEQITVLPMAWTPLRVSLGIGWMAVALGLLAAAILLRGVLKMSERRAAFVSSVTHELRTPLTTFQLYSDLLAEGMVQDEQKRQRYLDTLRREAGRLNHLIENVLAYSRIERGSARTRREHLPFGSLIGRIEGRLTDRVSAEGAEIVITTTPDCENLEIDTDVTAVEQIVFNLVDNACKYGLPDEGERVVRLYASNGGRRARIEVCDDGTGISRGDARKLFRPFHKSAKDAAHSKPGVGLGLALCRRLARALGGDLTIDSSRKRGACFVLELPAG